MDVAEILPASCPELADALAGAGLPVDDLDESGRRFFRFLDDGGALVGFIGWELAGEAVLLRSLVVVPAMRGCGFSRRMMQWTLARLAEAGFAEAYLLTTSIADLAGRMGFVAVDRAQVPQGIKASRQFTTLCPSSAVVMRRATRSP
ncbi:MAG TPA: arsenic resistance N-acetyltransferase ArsN2 [Candidatus Omnitrophota bacterium]|nr:arsenic resistance N-acetyltransferase ArsN2 [Candidatus Omnitrophota bacterium]